MKIACISYLHGFGGAEKQIIMLANGLADLGHNVTLISISDDNACYKINDNVRYVSECDKGKSLMRIYHRYLFLKEQLKSFKPDVTINYWYQSVYLLMLMSRNFFGKIIYSERGDPGDDEYSGLLGLIRRLTIHNVDGFVFQSEGARDYFDLSIQKKSVVIHNPISIRKKDYTIPYQREKRIINVGRLHPQKNQKLLISAFSLIADKVTDFDLHIYGDGELYSELSKMIYEKGMSERIYLHSSTSKILNIVNESSVFVLSSDFEGMPNALMEAMALGVPCISTDCKPGGARTLIRNGENGYIVPRNDPDLLAKMILYVIDNYEEAKKVGLNAQTIIQTHTPDYIYKSWENYIKQMTR